MADLTRCPVCFSLDIVHHNSLGWQCALCGVASREHEDLSTWQPSLAALLSKGQPLIKIRNPSSWHRKLQGQKRRTEGLNHTAASAIISLEREGLKVVNQTTSGLLGLPIPMGRWGEAIELEVVAGSAPPPDTRGLLTIGGICVSNEFEAIKNMITETHGIARHYAFALDTDDPDQAERFKKDLIEETRHSDETIDICVTHHPLCRDFGAQRNRVQKIAKTDWVLQLDCDETISDDMLSGIGWAIERGTRSSLKSIGFPRRNLVDGELTAHYPDIQYRLNRSAVRYTKPVHESPDVNWHDAGLCWLGAINHHLSGQRLIERSQKYEAISEGAGKPIVLALLQTPFELSN